MESLFEAAARCLMACEVEEKLHLTQQTAQAWRDDLLSLDCKDGPEPIGEPGHPAKPVLVTPDQVPRRGLGTQEGLAALVHAMAHIEFNAINLAWDAVYRFRDLPESYYSDWITVANEEADHFQLLRTRLHELGTDYGDFTAHNGLWDMARRTAYDPMVRMALVPRVLEARGLDATPPIMAKLRAIGDQAALDILDIVLSDEITHVAVGDRWFRHLCAQRGLAPEATFLHLFNAFDAPRLQPPVNEKARLEAGFSESEIETLANQRRPAA